MPFQYTLANLLADNEGALAVLFLDETGETVDLACTENAAFPDEDRRRLCRHLSTPARDPLATAPNLGVRPKVLHVEKHDIHLYATPLPEGYYLVLIQRRPALVARARANPIAGPRRDHPRNFRPRPASADRNRHGGRNSRAVDERSAVPPGTFSPTHWASIAPSSARRRLSAMTTDREPVRPRPSRAGARGDVSRRAGGQEGAYGASSNAGSS